MLHVILEKLKTFSFFTFITFLSVSFVQISCSSDERSQSEIELTEYTHKLIFNSNEGNSIAKVYQNGLLEALALDIQGVGEIFITNHEENYLLDSVTVEKSGFTKWTTENIVVQDEISFEVMLEEELSEFDILVAYMEANDMDLTDISPGWVIAGSNLTVDNIDYSIADYYIMDFRNAVDFADGHIKDANNVVFADLLNVAPADKTTKILCVCYTGQTAARATALLRLSGYKNAQALKWGMCAWHPDFEAKWETNAGDYASANWTITGTPPALDEFDDPILITGNTTGEAILAARIQAAIALPWIVSKTDVLANPSNYFINNIWPDESWNEYGHIMGAYRIYEILGLDELNSLNPDETVVTYCYAGHTSSVTTAWLQVLGFDTAKSLVYGASSIVYSALLVGTAGAAPKKTWKGVGSGSELNFGYYDSYGIFYPPL